MLENCVYDFFEMASLEMAQKGVFGEIIHAEGAYQHNLDPYWDGYWNDWRMDYNQKHRGDVYPTHGIGPICQALNIHRGDRMKTLVSMDTKSFNGIKIAERRYGKPCTEFANGDQTCTLIQTELGKTMLIEHDVMTPRPYSRMYQLVGTDGYASKYPVELYCLRDVPEGPIDAKTILEEKVYMGEEMEALQGGYRNTILTPELEALAKEVGGHGGMDFIMDYRLVYCLRNGLPLDMDVYDLAEWCCVGPLSAISLENGNMPVEIPDFTRGAWNQVNGFSYALAE
jgi:predicted dehydrogenase